MTILNFYILGQKWTSFSSQIFDLLMPFIWFKCNFQEICEFWYKKAKFWILMILENYICSFLHVWQSIWGNSILMTHACKRSTLLHDPPTPCILSLHINSSPPTSSLDLKVSMQHSQNSSHGIGLSLPTSFMSVKTKSPIFIITKKLHWKLKTLNPKVSGKKLTWFWIHKRS